MNVAFDRAHRGYPDRPIAGAPQGGDWAHVRFIHDLSRQLAGSLNVRRTVFRALDFAVPYLGAWGCSRFSTPTPFRCTRTSV